MSSFLLTHYQTTNFRLFQTERVCRRQFQFDENRRKLSKRVENIVGKGEIARYEQFLLFPRCFQKACFPGVSTGVIVWEWVNPAKVFSQQKIEAFAGDKIIVNVLSGYVEIIVGKEENLEKEKFLVTNIFTLFLGVFQMLLSKCY